MSDFSISEAQTPSVFLISKVGIKLQRIFKILGDESNSNTRYFEDVVSVDLKLEAQRVVKDNWVVESDGLSRSVFASCL